MAIQDVFDACTSVEELDRGGQKVVYAAQHPVYGDIVLKRGNYPHPGALERITREVDLLASISSSYYPKHFGFIVDVSLREFLIVEERIEGLPLSECVDRFKTEIEIIALLRTLVVALDLLWQQRVIHRDIKPQNIIIKPNNSPVVIDLGIARLLDLSSLTMAGAPVGPCTAAYAAPEQLQNKKPIIDPRADFFALGLLALQLALGFHPFDPQRVQRGESIPENILKGQYVSLERDGEFSESFLVLTDRLLKTEPHQRFRNRVGFSTFLDRYWGGEK